MPYLTHPAELAGLFPDENPYRAKQLYQWLYRKPALAPSSMTDLPPSMREALEESLWPFDVEVEQNADGGSTIKWLFRAPDGAAIEAVLMGYPERTTLCISSQVGCALACSFCATGQFGFERHLQAGEIVAQVAYARAYLRDVGLPVGPNQLTNIVFMGMGEPLANYDRVREATRRIVEDMDMSPRRLTVSTVGLVPGMLRLAEEPWPVNLAVSLHAADDELRNTLVPINKRYPLAEVEAAAANYFERKGRRVSIEWTLIDGVNDTVEQATRLSRIARRLGAHVNVIPLNATPLSQDQPSRRSRIQAFVGHLRASDVNVTVRDTRGADIDAACGQLRVGQAAPPEIRLRNS
ncbi:MAG TPA: 23S rRNA (adenine(2503)-C(2))-methyltransferase RlmN [Acidimicrobiia bacterium]|nr:23S rRNA (adenine(2503)-C(2))-methyltransferase RlmN [Acidimicrobiia bacterium]